MKVFYLQDSDGYIVSKFEMTTNERFEGRAYECISWDGITKKPEEWLFHSEVYAKWDGCSHWWFKGEDYSVETDSCEHNGTDGYYHICSSFDNFIRTMCFVWKLAGNYHINNLKEKNLLDNERLKEYNLELVDYMLKDYKILESDD